MGGCSHAGFGCGSSLVIVLPHWVVTSCWVAYSKSAWKSLCESKSHLCNCVINDSSQQLCSWRDSAKGHTV